MSRTRKLGCATLSLVAIGLNAAAADQGTSNPSTKLGPSDLPQTVAPSLPPFKTERWDEDYTYLRNSTAKQDFFDPIKYVPLGSDPDWYVTFGGLVRDRYEYFNHLGFGGAVDDHDGYNLLRLDAYADVHMSKFVRVFVEGRSALDNGREPTHRLTDLDTLDPQQAFADLMLPLGDNGKLTLRAGRQELLFGAERLIGPADWLNVRRTFDGVRGTFTLADNQLDLFLTRPVQIEKYDFDNADNSTVFAGIYDTLRMPQLLPDANTKLEVYGLYLKRKNAAWTSNPGPGYEQRYTVGSRFSGQPKPFDFDLEGDYQFGTFKGEDISAWSFASEVGYNLAQVTTTPRLFVGFDIASGDNHPGGNLETFNQLFPSGHPFFGYMDFIGRQNIIDVNGGVDATLVQNVKWIQKMTVRAQYLQFWRQSDHDAVYQPNGSVLRAGASTARDIGSEADVILRWQIDRHLSTYFGYSHFFHGDFIQETGAHKDADFAYAAVTFTF